MATASAIEIKRAADAESAARTLREISERLERIEALLISRPPVAPKVARDTGA